MFDGGIVARAADDSHRIIAAAQALEIGLAVRARLPGCPVRSRAGSAPHGAQGHDCFETDILAGVSCRLRDAGAPRLIAEGLSASTDRDDGITKLPVDQRIAGLQEILHAEAERVGATVYRRNGG